MASDINVFTVTGRLTRDSELKYTNSGTAICEFSVASNWSKKVGDEWTEQVSYFDFVMFARRAEALQRYLTKGQQVCIQAEARQERWERDGQKRSKVKFYVQDIKLVGSKSGGSSGASQSDEGFADGGSEFDDSDVPF